jgi:ATP-binding cassette subfamily C (CFTR/MRP) protein 10
LSTTTVTTNFQKCTGNSSDPLLKSLHKCFGFEFYAVGILKLVADVCGFAGPILLNLLVNLIEDGNKDNSSANGYIYVFGMFSASLIGTNAILTENII